MRRKVLSIIKSVIALVIGIVFFLVAGRTPASVRIIPSGKEKDGDALVAKLKPQSG
jgi:hypothetical protein